MDSLHSEDGGSMTLGNAGVLPHHYMASQPRSPRLESSYLWKHQISQMNLVQTSHL